MGSSGFILDKGVAPATRGWLGGRMTRATRMTEASSDASKAPSARRVAAALGVGALALLVALPPASGAFSLEVLDGTLLERSVPGSSPASTFDFAFRFELADDERLDFVVVPAPQNPVYGNGGPSQGGWWTEVRVLEEGEEPSEWTPTNGTRAVQLGRLHDGDPITLQLRVHVPASALDEPGRWTLTYRLQEHDSLSLLGDDDEQVQDFQAFISVMDGEASTDSTGGAVPVPPEPWNASEMALVLGAAIMVLGLIAVVGGKR
jgi:hypothetical protein